MGCFLTPDELSKTTRASRLRNESPIPTHAVTNGEFTPPPRSELQRRFEDRLRELAEPLARKQGLPRRRFLKTAAGMAAAFVAMNEVFGPHFVVESAEAADPERAAAGARQAVRVRRAAPLHSRLQPRCAIQALPWLPQLHQPLPQP